MFYMNAEKFEVLDSGAVKYYGTTAWRSKGYPLHSMYVDATLADEVQVERKKRLEAHIRELEKEVWRLKGELKTAKEAERVEVQA